MGKELKYLVFVLAAYGATLLLLAFLNKVDIHPIYWINLMLSAGGAFLAFRIAILKGRPIMSFYFCGFYFLIYTFFSITLFTDDPYFNLYAYQYLSLVLELLLGITILSLTVFYLFNDSKPIYHIIVPLIIVLPVWLYFSREFIFNYQILMQEETYEPLFFFKLKIMTFNLFTLLPFWAYYVKTDKIITQYLSSLMFGFTILVAFSILHTYTFVSNLEIHYAGQYWTFGILLFIIWSLMLKLHSITGDFGRIYERILIYGAEYYIRRRGRFDRFICWCFFGREEIEKSVYLKEERRG